MNSPSAAVSRPAAFGFERRNERAEHDEAGVGHQPRHLAHAPDVLDAIGGGEAQVFVEAVANVIAVEQCRVHTARVKLGLDQIGDRGFPRARKPGEPEDRRLLVLSAACASRPIVAPCRCTLVARLSPCAIIPAAAVSFVWRSMRMKRRSRDCRRKDRKRLAPSSRDCRSQPR